MALSFVAIKQTVLTSGAIAALNVASGVVTARILGPEGRGELLSAMAVPALVAGLGAALMQQPLAARSAGELDEGASSRLRGLALSLVWVVAPALVVIACVVQMVLARSLRAHNIPWVAMAYGAMWIPVNLAQVNLLALDWGRAEWKRFNLLRAALYPITLGGLLVLAVAGVRAVEGVLAIYLVSDLTVLLYRLMGLRHVGPPTVLGWHEIGAVLRQGRRFFGARAANALVGSMDQIVVSALLPAPTRGCYAVAGRFATANLLIASGVGFVSFADGAREKGSADADAQRKLRILTVALYLSAVAWAALAWWGTRFIFGSAFEAARLPGALMAGGGAFLSLATILEQRLEGQGYPRWPLRARIAMVLVFVGIVVGAGGSRQHLALLGGAYSVSCLARLLVVARGVPETEGGTRRDMCLPSLRGLREALALCRAWAASIAKGSVVRERDARENP